MSKDSILKFAPFTSSADASFWHELSQRKLNEYGLNDEPISISGFFNEGVRPGISPRLCIGGESFNNSQEVSSTQKYVATGKLYNTNTIEAFRTLDIPTLAKEAALQIWQDIKSGEALKNPSLLNRFVLFTFANLKKFQYRYWFGFPAARVGGDPVASLPQSITDIFSKEELDSFSENLQAVSSEDYLAAFLVKRSSREGKSILQFARLSEFKSFYSNEDANSEKILAFADPSGLKDYPGWPLRNLLLMLAYHFGDKHPLKLKIIGLRNISQLKSNPGASNSSLCLDVQVPPVIDAEGKEMQVNDIKGLEKDSAQKLRPRLIDLSANLDPKKLAESAVGLNLSLMRWRLMPDIDLKKIAETRCLLVGSGTLGCNVARLLLGWGVKNITFIDSGRVSYSNPVRQTLFTFEDCLDGGKNKAEAAADRLRHIYPCVNTKGYQLSVPMPGHAVSGVAQEEALKNAKKLETLIDEHDAVFCLTDSRESRWLPTLCCAAKNKICLTAAVGFDSFVAMRHGVQQSEQGPRNIGCYFCNDVVAPVNSQKDRSLDQQCTVSRPGISMTVSSVVVEMLVALIHHPKGALAPHTSEPSNDGSPLGAVPHQVRGSFSNFGQMMLSGQAFEKCTACSQKVVDEFKKGGDEFLLASLNQPTYLEDMTGLSHMHAEMNAMDDIDLSWSDSENSDEGADDAT
eukprot:m.56210 g.56210  ORF g.56210 m.56210 type:complete len:686 (-) comp11025_c0_seq2:1628-3685(-)